MIHVAWFGIEAGLAVLLTYLVHSTVWVGGALLLTRLRRALAPTARHLVWRAALVGPLASSALALGPNPGWQPGWQWALTGASRSDESRSLAAAAGAEAAAAFAASDVPARRPRELAADLFVEREVANHSADDPAIDAGTAALPLVAAVSAPRPMFPLLAGGWGLVAIGGLLLIARAAVRRRRALEPRTRVTHAACLDLLARLVRLAGIRHPIRLSQSATASTPQVLSGREICLPERALDLDREALEAVLAHELAHIERRDAAWLNAAHVLQALLWFQPLHRKLLVELRESAELAADDRAVELTGDALGLARTLTHVASWVSDTSIAASVAMARPGSAIVERVARLVDSGVVRPGSQLGSRTPWLALATLAAIGACSPSVGAPRPEPPRAGNEPATIGPARANTTAAPVVAPPSSATHVDKRPPPPEPVPAASAPPAALPPAALPPVALPARPGAVPPTSASAPPIPPMPPLPIDGLVGDVVAGVVPRAIEFSNTIVQLAMNEAGLGMRIERAEAAAAQPGASPETHQEVARLKQELAASTQRRERMEKDFEERMGAWSKEFEARFERDHAQRFEAWGEELGRRMEAMGKDLGRQLAPLRSLAVPVPPALTIDLPTPPNVPRFGAPRSTPPRTSPLATPPPPPLATPPSPPPTNQ